MTFKINIPADPNIIDTFIPRVSAWKSKEIHHVWIQAFIFRTYSSLAPRALRESGNSALHPAGKPEWGSSHLGPAKGDVIWGGIRVPKNPGGWSRGGCRGVFRNHLFSVGICIVRCLFHTFNICFLFLFPSHATLVSLGLSPHRKKKKINEKYGVNITLYLKEQ